MAKSATIAKVSSNKQKRLLLEAKRKKREPAPAPARPRYAPPTQAELDLALAKSRANERGGDLVGRLAAGELLDLPAHSPLVQVRALFDAARRKGTLPAALRLVESVPRAVDLLGADRDGTHAAWFLGLADVAWLRPPEEWAPGTRNARRALASLTRHLVARWPVPAVLDGAWASGEERQRAWWLHVASGQNLRTAEGLPFPLTKRAAHEALLAPEQVGVAGALRWGQVLSLGGTARLARALLGTRLGRTVGEDVESEVFWETVIRWLVGHPLLDPAQLGPIVDFLHAQKFVVPAGANAAPQPGLTMRDRQPRALLAQVAGWHRRLARARRWVRCDASIPLTWVRSPALADWAQFGPDGRIAYRVVPLLSVDDLVVEGERLEHCVASYAWSCARGTASIWSLRRPEKDGFTPLLTIEVDPRSRRVVQARRKRNAYPDAATTSLLQRWARWAQLEVAGWVLDAR